MRVGQRPLLAAGDGVEPVVRSNVIRSGAQADREIADIDHLLHSAEAFGGDLADLQRDETAEGLFVGAKLFAEQARRFTAPGAGTSRQEWKAAAEQAMVAAGSGVSWTAAMGSPSMG